MKLIIDIPDNQYNQICKTRLHNNTIFSFYDDAIRNGIPLDKIRAEIMKLQTYKMFKDENTVYSERDDVLAIIDKYKEYRV